MRSRLLVLFLCCYVIHLHAQGAWSGSGSMSGSGVLGPGPAPPCSITPITLPSGVVSTAYGPIQLTSSNCSAPVVWSVSVGTLPNGLSLTTGGLLSGTPTVAGSSSFTITLVDHVGHSPVFPLSVTIVSVTVAGAPLPPDSALTAWDTSMAGTPTGTVTLCVGTPVNASILPGGGCRGTPYAATTAGFQSALNAVGCGQIVNVASTVGGTPIAYGAQKLPHGVVCTSSTYVWVTHDLSDANFPAEGIRVDPSYIGIPQSAMPFYPYPLANGTPNAAARHMPQIIVPASTNFSCFSISTPTSGANTPSIAYWRIQGFECTRDQSADDVTALIDLNYQPNASGQDCALTGTGNTALPVNAVACKADQPNHVIIAQNVIHGDAQRQTTRGISMGGGTFIAFKDNYGYDIQTSVGGNGSSDAQFYAGGFGHGYTGVGDWIFDNNFTASSTEGNLFCGSFTEAKSPATNADGIPTSVIWNHDHFYKPIVWDTQRGQTLNETLVNENTSYPPIGDQEFIVTPSAIQVQQGNSIQLDNTWLNDSAGGWNHFSDGNGSGSEAIDGQTCSYNKTTTVGTTAVGTSVVVASATGWAVGQPILIVGAGSGGNNYSGTITNISGTTFTISPATSLSVATGSAVLFPDCLTVVAGVPSSANGILRKDPQHIVGSGVWKIGNAATWTFIACLGANNPDPGCTVATNAGPHTVTFNRIVVDDGLVTGLASLGNNRTLPQTSTMTVTASAPVNQISLSPSAPDLQIQPSYTDTSGNRRQFGYVFFARLNFSSVSLAWRVCDASGANCVTNGNASVGQICLATAIPCSAPGSNDTSVVYISGTAVGTHTITVTSAAGTSTSQVINVSMTSPIWAYDLKAMAEKNGWEAKCVNRGLLHNSIIENTWGSQAVGGGQNGPFVLDQSVNQSNQTTDGSGNPSGYGPQNISDFQADHVHGLHGATGLVVASLNQALGIHRLNYIHILFEDTNCSRYSHGFLKTFYCDFQQFSGTTSTTKLSWTSTSTPLTNDINASHITEVGGTPSAPGVGSWLSLANNTAQFQLGPYSVKDSIFVVPGSTTFQNNNGDLFDCNTASGNGAGNTEARALQGQGYSPALPCFSTYSINRNLLLDNTTVAGNFTSTIWNNVASTDPTVFRSYGVAGNGGDYRLAPGSPYAAGGARCSSDGCIDLGADVASILTSDGIVRWGGPTPMTISTANSLPNATHGVAYSQTLTVSGGTGPYVWSVPGGIQPPGALDILDWAMMPQPTRNSFCLSGPSNPKCFHLDGGLMWWMKAFTGNPWDGEVVGSDYVKQWFTENIWSNASSFKMYQTPVNLWARYHQPGADDVVYTPGPNKYSTTTNCGADNLPLIDNLGVRGELTGPFTDVLWQTNCIAAGGTLTTCSIPDNTPYLLAQKWIKCTANNILNCTNEEDYWLVKGYGQAQWCPKTISGGTYVNGTCTNTMQVVSQAAVTPNFACGVPAIPTSGLPAGIISTSSPQMNLHDTTGVLDGTPLAAGTSTFVVQVEDSVGHIAQKTLTLVVQ